MESNNNILHDIADNDLLDVSCSLSKIRAATLSTYSYLNSVTNEPNEPTNNVLYMLNIIDELSKMTNNKLLEIMDKLYAI